MALNTLKCNHLTTLSLKGLTVFTDLLRLMLLSNTIQLSQSTVAKYHRCLFANQCISMSINLKDTTAAVTHH